MKLLMKVSAGLFALLALTLLAGAVINAGFDNTLPVYNNPFVLALFAALAVLTLLCCLNKKWLSLHGVGFLLCHVAFVLFLAAAFVYYVVGEDGELELVIGGPAETYVVQDDGMGTLTLPFSVACSEFDVEYYPQQYAYSAYDPAAGGYAQKGRAARGADGTLDLGKYGVVPAATLAEWEASGEGVLSFGETRIVADGAPAVREYTAQLRLDGGAAQPIRVNHPVRHGGWKFYLMSYRSDNTGTPYAVVLHAKRDPALGVAVAGLALLPVGTFLLCLRRRNETEEVKKA